MRIISICFFFIISLGISSHQVYGQNMNFDSQMIQMIKDFYQSHCLIWTNAQLYPEAIDQKMDSLQTIYCTSKLRQKAQKLLKEDGIDFITKDLGVDISSLKKLTVTKDLTKENVYIVSFISEPTSPGKLESRRKVVLHLTVIKENDKYKIDELR